MYTVREIEYLSPAYEASLLLRHEVLRAPWGCSIAQDDLSGESENLLLGAFCDQELVGIGTLVWQGKDTAQARYMAVAAAHRGHGVGSKILKALEEEAIRRGVSVLKLNARETAITFYEQFGYELIGDLQIPDFVPLPHAMMAKRLKTSKA